jgi:hypothetical protein
MLFDKGLFWLIVIVLVVVACILFGVYNRQSEADKSTALLVVGWVILGIALLFFAWGLFQAMEIKNLKLN